MGGRSIAGTGSLGFFILSLGFNPDISRACHYFDDYLPP